MSRSTSAKPKTVSKPAFCEIFIQGYGNGLNEAKTVSDVQPDDISTENGPDHHDMQIPTVSLVTRESSKSSGYSRSTGKSTDTDELTEMDHLSVGADDAQSPAGSKKVVDAVDVDNDLKEIHFNKATWDAFLAD
jgi:hypothetical protein